MFAASTSAPDDNSGTPAALVGRPVAEGVAEGVRLAWTTAPKADCAGFIVWRQELEAFTVGQGRAAKLRFRTVSPWRRIQPGLLTAAGPEYTYLDATAQAGRWYRYRLESVDALRARTLYPIFGPAQATATDAAPAGDGGATRLKLTTGPAGGLTVVGPEALAVFGEEVLRHWRRCELRLESGGRPVPFVWLLDATGRLERLVFWAAPYRTAYTDRNVYWLARGPTEAWGPVLRALPEGGWRQVWPAVAAVAAAGAPAGVDVYTAVARAEQQAYYTTSLPEARPGEERWYYAKAALVVGGTLTETLAVSAPAVEGEAAALGVALRGVVAAGTSPQHRVSVSLNGVALGEVAWDGLARSEAVLTVPAGALVAGANQVTLALPKESGGGKDQLLLDWVELRYSRQLEAAGGALAATLATPVAPGHYLTAAGFAPGALVLGAETSAPDRPEWLIGRPADDGVRLATRGRPLARLAAAELGTLAGPERVEVVTGEAAAPVGCAYLAVAAPELVEALAPLLEQHRANGLTVAVTTPEACYRRYSYGRVAPEAIRDWIRAVRPAYVLLVGETVFDVYGYTTPLGADQVPAWRVSCAIFEHPTDLLYAYYDDRDAVPDCAVGRIAAADAAGVAAAAAKALARAAALAAADESAAELELLAVADNGPAAQQAEFEGGSELVAERLGVRDSTACRRLYLSRYSGKGCWDQARADLQAAWRTGPRWVNYFGHGNHLYWAGEQVLRIADVAQLVPPAAGDGARYPVTVQLSCITGFYNLVGVECLGEVLLETPGCGAAAVVAAAGTTTPEDNLYFARGFYTAARDGATVGEAFRAGAAAVPSEANRARYVLLGDPAMP